MTRRRVLTIAVSVLGFLAVAGGLGNWATSDWDTGRVWYKRMKASSPYVFDEIPDGLRQTDPASIISLATPDDVARTRTRINNVLWGSPELPDRLPTKVEQGNVPGFLASMPNVARSERLEIPFEYGYKAYAYVLVPDQPNNRALVYHHGYAGTVEQASELIQTFLKRGYTVAAINYAGYGNNDINMIEHPRFGTVSASNDRQMYYVENPLRWYLEPMVVTVNYLKAEGFTDISAIGFSAGGWVATMVAAVDTRIRRTAAVASGYPLYIRALNWGAETPLPQMYKPLLDATNYLDLYVLASAGAGRKYLQIFNQYDRCCFRNRFSELYASAVSDAVARIGKGRFAAVIDTSHADHKISPWGLARLVAEITD